MRGRWHLGAMSVVAGIFRLIGDPSPFNPLMFPLPADSALAYRPGHEYRNAAVVSGRDVLRLSLDELKEVSAQAAYPFTQRELAVIERRRTLPAGHIPREEFVETLRWMDDG